MREAKRRCPEAIVVSPRMSYYSEISSTIMSILDDFSPRVEALSLDEAFVDMTGAENLFGPPEQMAKKIRDAIYDETQLTASIGIAPNKFLAKLASDLDKPDGVTRIPPGRKKETIAPMDIERLWGVGDKTSSRLRELGFETIGDIATANRSKLSDKLGALGEHLHKLANGEDKRTVVPNSTRKSVGSERTHSNNLFGREQVAKALRSRCEDVAQNLRQSEIKARGIRVKLRYDDNFQIRTRQTSLPTACDDSKTLWRAARTRLGDLDLERPVRLVGAAAYDLVEEDAAVQTDLFTSQETAEASRLEHTLDEIRDRFGDKIDRGPQLD
jgi:DNA polymerase-4